MRREEFLARVAAALGRRPGDPVGQPPAPPPGTLVAPSLSGLESRAQLVEAFAEAATASGALVLRAQTRDEAVELAAARARELGQSLAASDEPLAQAVAAAAGLDEAPPERADVGVTGAWRALAETGSLVLRSEPGRLVAALPPVQVCVLRAVDVIADLSDLIAELHGEPPSALVAVTGPSKTADIEQTLITGVHGPGRLIVVLLGKLTERSRSARG